MKWDKVNKVFRPGDYSVDLWWFNYRDAFATLLSLGSKLQALDSTLAIVQYKGSPFHFDQDSVQKVIEESIGEFIQLRGDYKHLNSPSMTFRTGLEGVDLRLELQIAEERPPVITLAGLDFDEEHLSSASGIFSSDKLRYLFRELILAISPNYAALRRKPPVTATWYELTRVSIDTTKVPIVIEWFNFFSWEWVKRIGEKKFQRIPEGEVEKLPTGFIYILQEQPFSYNNPEHTDRQQRMNKHFDLKKLHKKYPYKYSY